MPKHALLFSLMLAACSATSQELLPPPDAARPLDAGRDGATTPVLAPPADAAVADAATPGGDAAPVDARAPSGDAGSTTRTTFVYVGSGWFTGPASALHAFRLDDKTGKLGAVETLAVPRYATFLATHPTLPIVYSSVETKPASVTAYDVDLNTGKLSLKNMLGLQADGIAFLSISHQGRFAFAAHYTGHSVSVLGLKASGELDRLIATRAEAMGAFPHAIRSDPSDGFVFVPNRSGESVSQYRLSAEGALTPNAPASVTVSAGTGPRHLAFHPNGRFLYVVNETNSTLTAYTFDKDAGTLAPIASASTLPAGFNGKNNPADLHVHPSGRWAYAVNRGHASLAIFRLDASTGQATLVGHQTTGADARNFAIDPSGRYLVLGVLAGHRVRVYRVDETAGTLTETDVVNVDSPSGITILSR